MSEATALRDAIHDAAWNAAGPHAKYIAEVFILIADDILAMPEMQAIRAWMNWAFEATVDVDDATNDDEPPLPDSVIAWMDGAP